MDTMISSVAPCNELALVKNVVPALINFNYEELENALKSRLKDFQNLIITDDCLKDAKISKKELAGLRLDLDAFRKAAKKEAEKPIKEFEAKMKKLIALIEETEKPLDESINVYNEKVREEKRNYARGLIQEAIAACELRPEYAARMMLKEEYANLSGTKKAVKESILKQAEALKQEQDNYDSNICIINAAVEQENKRLTVKLHPEKFRELLGNVSVADIISLIKEQAYDIYQQENMPQKVSDEELKGDTIVDFQNIAVFDAADVHDSGMALSSEQNTIPEIPDCFILPPGQDMYNDILPVRSVVPAALPSDTTEPADISTNKRNMWKCVFEVYGDFQNLRELNQYMKNHNIDFQVISQEQLLYVA